MDTFNIKCCDEQHAVYMGPRGDVTFHDHPGLSTSLMATEYGLNESVGGCFLVAHALRSASNPAGRVPLWVLKRLEAMEKKREHRVERRRPNYAYEEEDQSFEVPCSLPLAQRVLLPEHPLAIHAQRLLDQAQFRTSKITHRTEVLPTGDRTSVVGKSESVPDAIEKKGKLFAGKRQVVRLHLNVTQWAPVALRRAGLVQTFFVCEILRVWSKTELEVLALKQSVGYQVNIKKAVIRQAHDGVWRIYEWL